MYNNGYKRLSLADTQLNKLKLKYEFATTMQNQALAFLSRPKRSIVSSKNASIVILLSLSRPLLRRTHVVLVDVHYHVHCFITTHEFCLCYRFWFL